jgi:hypothetical protein
MDSSSEAKLVRLKTISARVRSDHRDLRIWTDCLLRDFARELQHAVEQVAATTSTSEPVPTSDAPFGTPGVPSPVTMAMQVPSLQLPDKSSSDKGHSLTGSRSPSLGTSMSATTPSHRGSVQLQPVPSIVVFNRPLSARRKESAVPADSASTTATTTTDASAPSGNDRSETAVFQEKEGRHNHLSSSGSSNLSREIDVEEATDTNKKASDETVSPNAVGSAVYLWDIFRTADGRSGQYLLDEIDEEDETMGSHQGSYEGEGKGGSDGKSSEGGQTPNEEPPLEIGTMDGEGENGDSEEEINLEQFVLNHGDNESTESNGVGGGGEGDGKGKSPADRAAFSIRTATQLLRWKTRSTERISMATVYKHMQERFVSKLESGDLVLQAGSMSELQHIPVQLQANPAFYTPEMLAKRSEIRGSLETRSILRSLWGLLPRKESSKSMDPNGAGDGANLAASLNSKGKHPSKPTPPTSSGNKAVAARVSAIVAAKNAEKDNQKKKPPTAHQDDSEVVDPLSQTHITFNTYCAIATYLFRRLLPQGTLREFAAVLKEDWAKESGSDTATTMDYKHFSDAMFETIDVWCPTMNPNDYSIFAEYVLRPVCTKAAKHDPDTPFRIGKLWKSKKKAYYGPILQTARRAKAWNGEPISDDTERKEDEDDVEDGEDVKIVALTTAPVPGGSAKGTVGKPLASSAEKSPKPTTTPSVGESPATSERSNSRQNHSEAEVHAQGQQHPLPKSNTPPPVAGERTSSRTGTRSTTPKSGGIAPRPPKGPLHDGATAVPLPTTAATMAANKEPNESLAANDDAITTGLAQQQCQEATTTNEVKEDLVHALGQPGTPAALEAPLPTQEFSTDGPTTKQEDMVKIDRQREDEGRMRDNGDTSLPAEGGEPPSELIDPVPPPPFPGDSMTGDLRPTTTVGGDRAKPQAQIATMSSTGASAVVASTGSWVSIPGKGKYASRTAPLSSTGMMLANSGSSFLPPSVYFVSNTTFGRPDEANAVAAPSSWALPALLPHSAALHNHQLEGTALAGAGGPGGSRRSPTKGKLKIGPVSRTSIIPGVLSMQAAQELQGHSAEAVGEGAERHHLPPAAERQQYHHGDEIERFATGGTTIPSLSESENRVAKNHPEKALRVLPSVGVSARQSPPRRHPGAAATVPVERTQPTFDSAGGSEDSRNLYVGLPPQGAGSGGSAHSPDRDAVGGVAPAPPPPGSRQGLRGAGSPKRARPLPSSLSNSRTDTQSATPIRPQTQGGVPAPNSEPLNRARAKELHLIMRKVTSSESGGSARKPVAGTRAHAMQLTPRPPTRDKITISQRGEAVQQQ